MDALMGRTRVDVIDGLQYEPFHKYKPTVAVGFTPAVSHETTCELLANQTSPMRGAVTAGYPIYEKSPTPKAKRDVVVALMAAAGAAVDGVAVVLKYWRRARYFGAVERT